MDIHTKWQESDFIILSETAMSEKSKKKKKFSVTSVL